MVSFWAIWEHPQNFRNKYPRVQNRPGQGLNVGPEKFGKKNKQRESEFLIRFCINLGIVVKF